MASAAIRSSLLINLIPCNLCRPFVVSAISNGKVNLNPSTVRKKMVRKTAHYMKKMQQRVVVGEQQRKSESMVVGVNGDHKKDGIPWTTQYLRNYTPHRAKVLENVLLEHVSDLLCSDFFMDLGDETVELTGVDFNRAHNVVNILYAPKGIEEHDRKIYEKLQQIAPELRHQLCQQHILGHVPRLEFMQDKAIFRLQQLERQFSRADYGPTPSIEVSSEEVLKVTVEASPVDGVSTVVEESSSNAWNFQNVPAKRTDVAGLDREKILASISPILKSEKRKKLDVINISTVAE